MRLENTPEIGDCRIGARYCEGGGVLVHDSGLIRGNAGRRYRLGVSGGVAFGPGFPGPVWAPVRSLQRWVLGGDMEHQGMTKYDQRMSVERLTISIESELAVAVREAAEADEQNVSAWLADAARRRLATRGLRDVVAAWEREHGAFSDEELAAARTLVDG